ncbi:hypothetical protein GLOTRDRAFT_134703 [Gloeophyllum trabeum ATCC 11539]|uniref:Uncharacterized protein n=1 Tax=Gloeophyllum trabeum (strain ATCC 11539 / FP-39264 / Madison 617) TaxID=670483 RepID=S7R5Q5_GLOTA|nr:uncharacterized protein GLOTRDRAFT_134703 [Gloeophyllum trabeum ATCC 11539]EPQ49715.1 hypothetical protein GLOTRDRAFT_134703 [Gloeophyllum trabeum ATCC 11539]
MLATHQRAEQEDWHPCLFPCLEGMKIRPRRDRLGVGEKQKQREVRSLVKMLQEYLRERHDRRWRLEELGAWVEAFPGVDVDATFKGLLRKIDGSWVVLPLDTDGMTDKRQLTTSDVRDECLVNRLVPEILGNVFLHALGDDYSNTIVPLTHVCRYWREVALGYPLLWCKPSSCHLEFLETALHRNKRVGLELDIDTHNVNQNIARPVYDRATSADLRRRILQAVQIKLAHVGDATSIRLHSRTTEFFRAALEALQTDAPFLESLDIQNAGWMTETDARNVLVDCAVSLRAS